MMADPAVIHMDDGRILRTTAQSGHVHLHGLDVGPFGFEIQLTFSQAKQLLEDIEHCIVDEPLLTFDDHPGYEHRCTYRHWHYWVQSSGDAHHQPWVYNPEVNEKPGPLGAYSTHAEAIAGAMAWIDRQYLPSEVEDVEVGE